MPLKPYSKILFTIAACCLLVLVSVGSSAEVNLEEKLISSIGISGNYPYIENKIRRYLTIRPGDPYSEKVMDDQIARIKQFYKREGWFDTEVTIRPEYIEDYDSVAIHIKIERGFLLRYRNITVTGNYSLPTSLVASKINQWKPYKPRRLREALHRIAAVYRKKWYPLARVRVTDKNLDLEKHRIDVTVDIEQGPYVSLNFKGNKNLGGKHLEKIVTIYSEGAIDSFELEESAKAIKARYGERGFPNAKITFTRKEKEEGWIDITFNIDEGKPERIRNIFIEGNEEIKSNKIKKQMLSKSLSLFHPGIYSEAVLKNDVKRISFFYKSKGFLDETTDEPYVEKVENETQLNIILPIIEGNQTKVKAINFFG